jgi:hypothetical protein
VKSIVMHAAGVLITFIVSVVLMLVLKGMLVSKPPFIVPPPTRAVADSTSVAPVPAQGEDAAPAEPAAAEPHSEYQRSPEDSLALALAGVTPATAPLDTTAANDVAIEDGTPAVPAEVPNTEGVAHLVRVYEKMRPKQVAQILDSLSDANTLAILSTMKDRTAAKVIAGMDPTNAARLSEMLAKDEKP